MRNRRPNVIVFFTDQQRWDTTGVHGNPMDLTPNFDRMAVLLFTSAHGCHFKTRNSEYKRSCHESSVHVPTALYGPGFTGGGRIDELVSLIDLPPTLLDAAGIDVPTEMQGRSILPLLKGEADDWPEEAFIQVSEAQVGRAVRTARWKYGVDAPDKQGGKDAGSDTYVEQYLYDLQADPYELTNLVQSEAHEVVREVMRERLVRRMTDAGEEAPSIVKAEVKRIGQRKVTEEEARS